MLNIYDEAKSVTGNLEIYDWDGILRMEEVKIYTVPLTLASWMVLGLPLFHLIFYRYVLMCEEPVYDASLEIE